MTPEAFIARWRGSTRTESSASHEHFLDLCELLGVEKPADVDKHAAEYTFEKSVVKLDGSVGYADVWKRHCFAWEYKGPNKSLVRAYAQLKEYADALENPPLLIVSDMQEIRVHTNFTNSIAKRHTILLADLITPETRILLRNCFRAPERLRPIATRETVTHDAAVALGRVAGRLKDRGFAPTRVAHFLNKLVFCLFSEDIDLLPNRVFAEIVEEAIKSPDDLLHMLRELFVAMAKGGMRFGATAVPWFNGGLFNDDDVLTLEGLGITDLAAATQLDWSAIDPSIFGTLFEAGLDPDRRRAMATLFDTITRQEPPYQPQLFAGIESQAGVGIHYTDAEKITKLIAPVVTQPLWREWRQLRDEAIELGPEKVSSQYRAFHTKLENFRVLDPACGSGNFLALALTALKDFDAAIVREAAVAGLPSDRPRVGPQALLGMDADPYAAELARLSVWITELQWQLKNGVAIKRNPILGVLDGIIHRDALMTDDVPTQWPAADVVIGNPPFLGNKLIRSRLTGGYADKLFAAYANKVSSDADLVTYWFAKAWDGIEEGRFQRAGLVATNSIRGGANRRILDRIARDGIIYDAWDDEPWVLDGAAVRVSLICFSKENPRESIQLDGRPVQRINSDLTETVDLTTAQRLRENRGISFQGPVKIGPFDIPGSLARQWITAPLNPNGHPNTDVVRPWANGMDLVQRPSDKWIVDFAEMEERVAALYEAPFEYIRQAVKPLRDKNRRDRRRLYWWLHGETVPGLRSATEKLKRFILTPRISKHRIFVWADRRVLPDSATVAIAREDETSFGILHSRFHRAWALRLGTSLEDRPRYTPSTTFETFPFPDGLTPDLDPVIYAGRQTANDIACAAKQLAALRTNWLNPEDLIDRKPEIVSGYPERILAKGQKAASELRKKTLTNLYNAYPSWLAVAHRDLDDAVAEAYGWPSSISEDDAVGRLLELNLARAMAS
jgi:type II restriction/modification system DNA methylase subunit YeeA